MYILGIDNAGYDTSCALMKDGEIVCAICEERLNREKRTKKFPINALKYCLHSENISLKDISHVAIAWNPGINLERMNTTYSEKNRFIPEFLYSIPNYLIDIINETPTSIEQKIEFKRSNIAINYLDHHMCHAAFSFYTSKFQNALILSMDAWGEKVSTLLANGTDKNIEKIWEIEFPYSLGMFYQAMTQYLGFSPQGDEWKVMGASSYGDKEKYISKINKLIYSTNDGKFGMDLSYFDYMSFTKKYYFSNRMIELLGSNRSESDDLGQRHYDIAAAVQSVFENIIIDILNRNNTRNFKELCISGGCAMNCVANGKILAKTNFEKINVTFSPDDAGTSIGACLLYWNEYIKNSTGKQRANISPYLSKDFTNEEIALTLNNCKLKYKEIDNPAHVAAKCIAEGQIVGWFQGRMEFGQRALGNRSILADPRRIEMKDMINKAVKYREPFRPFAPAILHEYGNDFFEDYDYVPYMERVLSFKKDCRKLVPAVCHVDNTGRLQSVTKSLNPLFWQLIDEFRKITEIPLVLNTSFNLSGEPIVHSVADAIRTFNSCGMDILIIGKYQVQK
ncbi:MAG: carbamoyltransferase [Candidatus Scalindua sp.]|nr:carbamoyltransferase [Candidatus Scalindua sp.]